MNDFKFIRDTIHGSVKVSGPVLELIDTPEVQRLRGVAQLGLANLVYPGANHTRFEHSLGCAVIAEKIARSLALDEHDRKLLMGACLLHDVGHGPFSHTLEMILHETLGLDHMDMTKRIILGSYSTVPEGDDSGRIPEILKEHAIPPEGVADLVSGHRYPGLYSFEMPVRRPRPTGNKAYLSMLVHGTVDADQMDYLLRDAHHTGVAYGIIDMERILNTLMVHDGRVVVHRKGVTAVEGMLVARALMYSAVYMHRTVRIAELMLARAAEHAIRSSGEDVDIQRMCDADLIGWLGHMPGAPGDMVRMLRCRRLYKRVHIIPKGMLSGEMGERLAELSDPERRREVEAEIARKAGAPEGSVIVDIPRKELLISEPRIVRTDIPIWDDGVVRPFSSVSTLSSALRTRDVMDWLVMAASHPDHTERVRRAAAAILM